MFRKLAGLGLILFAVVIFIESENFASGFVKGSGGSSEGLMIALYLTMGVPGALGLYLLFKEGK